jgi:thiol-disulfide isomerase/thioredoxin
VLFRQTAGVAFPTLVFANLLLIWLDPAVCASQVTPNQYEIIPIPHPVTSLLRSKSVHRELGLSADQIDEAEKALAQVDLPLWRLRDLPVEKRNGDAATLIGQLRTRLSGLLSARQIERLNQIVWQAQGIEAVLDPQVAAMLSLSAQQSSNIAALQDATYKKLAALQRNTQIRSEAQRTIYIRQLQAEARQNILALLNSYQQQTLTALTGRPFDLSRIRSIACKAPEFEIDTWLNSAPVKLSELKGKVTVIHFYAFGCGNCIRTLPYYNDWLEHFDAESFGVVAIHRPETKQERDIEKVKDRASKAGMEYPVAIDNDSKAWQAWANHIWPSIYLIDKDGYIRYWWYGELNWQGAESEKLLRSRIRELIRELPAERQISAGN